MDQSNFFALAKRVLGRTVCKTVMMLAPLTVANNLQASIVVPAYNSISVASRDNVVQLSDPDHSRLLFSSPSGPAVNLSALTNSPEPATMGLLGGALAFIGLRKRGRNKDTTK